MQPGGVEEELYLSGNIHAKDDVKIERYKLEIFKLHTVGVST